MEEQQQKATILAVDDSRVMLVAAAKALKGEFEVLKAADGIQAWEFIEQHPEISLIFSDLSMPNLDGYGLLEKIRSSDNPQIAKIPVVILTGQEDGDGTKEKVLECGATDFLIKPFESLDLLSRARSLASLSSQVNELEKKVSLDKLTRLYTEVSFVESGERAVAHSIRTTTPVSILRFDIDNFSPLFVKHGKQIAESIISKVAEAVKSLLRQEDIAARVGVSRFTLLMIDADQEGAKKVAERLMQAIAGIDFGVEENISLSIGCASPAIDEALSFVALREKAEELQLAAIAKGSGQIVFDLDESQPAAAQEEPEKAPEKKGPRIDLSAVLREIENNKGQRLAAKQMNAALNSVLPILRFLDEKMALNISESIEKMAKKVEK